ncbi:unnamed protein product [Pedinophyceae sp. YPF-701]|nr:unnamed protein product [Pedinophyceae sp. YPF-701]
MAQVLVSRGAFQRGSKLVFLSGRMGSLQDTASGGRPDGCYGYRMSKCALNMAAVLLARELAPEGVAVSLVDPGKVATGLSSFTGCTAGVDGWQHPRDAAEACIEHVLAGPSEPAPVVNVRHDGVVTGW